MKTLMILGTILGILSVYFIIDAEKSLIIKGNEVVPIGTDIPRLILNKAKEVISQIGKGDTEGFSSQIIDVLEPVLPKEAIETETNEMGNEIKNIVSGIANQIENSLRGFIGNKINESLCK